MKYIEPTIYRALRETVGDSEEIRNFKSKATVQLLDLNSGNNTEQVIEAIRDALPSYKGELKVTLLHPNVGKHVAAFATMEAWQAAKLLERKVLQVGPFSCRLRTCETVMRCFRCLGFGHPARFSEGPDRTDTCYKCGDKGHKASGCTAEPSCVACADILISAQVSTSYARASVKRFGAQ